MNELDPATIVFSLVLTWGIGLIPPLLIRFAALKRPMEKWSAIAVCVFFWFFNFFLFTAIGSQSKTHAALTFVAFVSYWLLRKNATVKERGRNRAAINEASGDGTTPLMAAAMIGRIKQIQRLISDGAKIDAVDERGWTPLMYAASRNEVEAVELLMAHGANPALRNIENQTASEIAQMKGSVEAASVLQG